MTKFKNRDLLIKALDQCIALRYHTSAMVTIRYYMAINKNTTFENALCRCEDTSEQYYIHHAVSRIYHSMVRHLNNEKFNMKKGIDNNE